MSRISFKLIFMPGILILSFFALFLLKSCEKDKFLHPVVHTGEVTDIGPKGAMFHGRITELGSEEIVDHGFVWDIKKDPVISESYIYSMGKLKTHGFSVFATSVWREGNIYYMRAYVSDGLNTYYGREVSFVSLGGSAPVISQIFPIEGTWGDTLTIKGKNFSTKPIENHVLIHNYHPEKILANDSVLKVIIPFQLDTVSSAVSLSIPGNVAISPERFRLLPPEMHDFNPKSAPYNDKVIIDGKFFKPDNTMVLFDTIEAEIIEQTYNSISVLVPKDFPEGELPISLVVFGQKVTSDESFFYQRPVIREVSPKDVTWGDNITIYGRFFGEEASYAKVKIDSKPAEILYHSSDSVIVKIPGNVLKKRPKIEIIVKTVGDAVFNQIILKDMIINSFSPQSGTFNDIIEIYGENFNPVKENNNVFLGNQLLIMESASQELLEVRVPSTNQVTRGKLRIVCGNMETISTEEFFMENHTIDYFSPMEGSRLDLVTIYGQGFSPDINTNKVYIGNKRADIISVSGTEITFDIPTGLDHGMQSIRVEVLGNNEEFAQQFMLYEPFKRLNNPVFGARAGAYTFNIDNIRFVGGGRRTIAQKDLYSYNPDSDTWDRLADSPDINSSGLAFSTSTKGYVIRKLYYECYMYIYDPITNNWTTVTELPEFSQTPYTITHTPFSVNDIGYVISQRYGPATLWAFQESSDEWINKGTLPFTVYWSGVGFTIGDKGYVAFGRVSGSDNRIWEYDPSNNTWTGKVFFDSAMPPGTTHRTQPTVAVVDNNAFIFGGSRDFSFDIYYNDVYRFDPVSNTIIRVPDIPGKGRRRAWAFSMNGKVYFGGGQYRDLNGDIQYLDDFYEFDPAKLPPPSL